MEKKVKLQATPAKLVQKDTDAQAEQVDLQPSEEQIAQMRQQQALQIDAIRRRMYMFGALTEEAGEISQIVGKIIRFGERDFHEKSGNIPNIELLHMELNDLFAVALELGWQPNNLAVKEKQVKLEKYWQYAKAGGNRGSDNARGQSKDEGQAPS